MTQVLRPYQSRLVNDVRTAVAAGKRRVLTVLPVGGGKTSCFAHVIERSTAGVLVLAHRKELIDQASARLDGQGVDHGVIMAGHPRRRPLERVQVASIQTLTRRTKPPAGIVIVDEAHRAKAASWNAVLDLYPGAIVLGWTATPFRLDGKPLGDVFDALVVGATARELVSLGHLAPVTGFSYDTPDLKKVRKSKGDYDDKQLHVVMGGTKIMGSIVDQWLPYRHLSTVVFGVNIEHSKELCARFVAAGARAEHIDGTTPKPMREAILARVASGETEVVCNVNVLTEGTDIPRLKLCILARPTMSLALYIQETGRVRRPWGGFTARIHDHAGCVMQHGLPDATREYSLERVQGKRSDVAVLDPLTTCKKCRAVYPAEMTACPDCGWVSPVNPRLIQEVEGDRIEFETIEENQFEVATPERMRDVFREYAADGKARGYKPGYAAHRFKARFGRWPERAWAVLLSSQTEHQWSNQ